jgi:hypothetical protein
MANEHDHRRDHLIKIFERQCEIGLAISPEDCRCGGKSGGGGGYQLGCAWANLDQFDALSFA